MKKFLISLIMIGLSFITFTSAAVVKTNSSTQEVSAKRILFTNTGLPNGIPVLDINNSGKILMYSDFGLNLKEFYIKNSDSLYTGFYISNWSGYSNQCSGSSNTVNISGLLNFWTGNTVYNISSGVYNIGSGIFLTGGCTVLTTTGTVIFSGLALGSGSIYISSGFNIISNIEINGISGNYDGIYIGSGSHNNTIHNVNIYKKNRGIYMEGNNKYNIFDYVKIYNSTIGISLGSQCNENLLNNSMFFNNTQNGIYINGGYRNTTNNSTIFNNGLYGYVVQSGTGNFLNNSIVFNNTTNGIRLVAYNNINNSASINQPADTVVSPCTGYSNFKTSLSAYAVGLKFGSSLDTLIQNVGFSSGSITTGYTITKDIMVIPYDENGTALFNINTGSSNWRGIKPFTGRISTIEYGKDVPIQITPVRFNTGSLLINTITHINSLKISSNTGSWTMASLSGSILFEVSNYRIMELNGTGVFANAYYIGTGLRIINSGNRISLQYLSGSIWYGQ